MQPGSLSASALTLRSVRRLVAVRRIPYIKLGGPVRFERAEVERFIESGRRPPTLNTGFPAGRPADRSRVMAGGQPTQAKPARVKPA